MTLLEPFDFWKNIDRLLFEKNMTVKQLCAKGQIPYKTLTMQRSRQTYPKLEELYQISYILDVSLDYLATGFKELAPNKPRSMKIAEACNDAEEYALQAIEHLLGIKKTDQADTLPREDAG